MMSSVEILAHVTAIRQEMNLEKRLRMLQELNETLPKSIRLAMPSLIANAYVRKALDIIEDRITISLSSTAKSDTA